MVEVARLTSTARLMLPLMWVDWMNWGSAMLFMKLREPEFIVRDEFSRAVFFPRVRLMFSLVMLALITSLLRVILPVLSPVRERLY